MTQKAENELKATRVPLDATVPPFSFGGPLLWLCVGLWRFEGSDAWQRDRWRLSIAGAALEPVIELCWLDPVYRVCFAHVVLAYISRSIPSRSTIPAASSATHA
jgi:hypothetical protein